MRKNTPEDLEPLAELLRRHPMTMVQIQVACGVTQRQAYRYLDVLRTTNQVGEMKPRRGASKVYWLQKA